MLVNKPHGMTIQKIILQTQDLERAEAFYHQVLELPVIDKTETSISFAAGYSVISFQLNEEERSFYHFAFLVPENKLDEAYRWVSARTQVLPYDNKSSIADFKNWNAHAFYFHDEQKNILEFIAHHDLPNASDETFGVKSIIGICEIGITVDDVAEACQQFNKTYGVPFFEKGPYMDDFAVMGTEDSLLIISATGRGWLPTGQPAGKYYLQVVLNINDRNHEISFNWW
jgi:catechol 2,3-dioxygenase-like lactoylglutathione lyase family enzyme